MASGIRDSGEHTPIDIDAAIDVVAREMTDLDPSAAMRAQVLERIEQGRRRPGLVLPRWAWAGVAATMVLAVATGIWLTRSVPGPGGSEGTVAERRASGLTLSTATPRPASVQPGSASVETTASPAGQPLPGGSAGRGFRAPATQLSSGTAHEAGELAWATTEIASLPDHTPVLITAVAIEPIVFADVTIQQLQTAPLDTRRGPDRDQNR